MRRELLTRDVDSRSAERGQFMFVQALIREVAYNTLARKRPQGSATSPPRATSSQLGSDELAGALAGHYVAAYDNAATRRRPNALAAQARLALRGAAERAANLGAYEQAVRFYEQALTVTAETAEQADLLERAGDAARTAAKLRPGRMRCSAGPLTCVANSMIARLLRTRSSCWAMRSPTVSVKDALPLELADCCRSRVRRPGTGPGDLPSLDQSSGRSLMQKE